MEKILIVGCKQAMDDVCIGCSRCMVGFNRQKIRAKAGVEVIEGTHPYKPDAIFA